MSKTEKIVFWMITSFCFLIAGVAGWMAREEWESYKWCVYEHYSGKSIERNNTCLFSVNSKDKWLRVEAISVSDHKYGLQWRTLGWTPLERRLERGIYHFKVYNGDKLIIENYDYDCDCAWIDWWIP